MTPTSVLIPNSFAARGARRKMEPDSGAELAIAGIAEILPSQGKFQDEFKAILKNPDAVSRWDEIISLGVRLKQERQLEVATKVLGIAAQAAAQPAQREQAAAELNAVLGAGATGMRIEFLTSSFASDAIQPKLIVPMMAGSFFGRLAGTALTGRLAQAAPGLLTSGTGARFVAGLASLAVEAPVFAGTQWTMNGYQGEFGDSLKRAGLTLGLLKLAGGATGEALRGLHGVGPLGATRLQNLTGLTHAILPQTAVFGSLLLSHDLEKRLGWIQDRPGANTFTDTLASMLNLSVGAHLGGRALGGELVKLQTEMSARSESALAARRPAFDRINEILGNYLQGRAGALAIANAAPISPAQGEPPGKVPQLWMASQLEPENRKPSKDSGGKSSTQLMKPEGDSKLLVKPASLRNTVLVRDAMMVGLKTLFSIDTLKRNTAPFIGYSALSAGFMALGHPILGATLFIGGGLFLIGSHVWRNVAYFLESGSANRSRNQIELSLNSRYAKETKVIPQSDAAFVEKVNGIAREMEWSPQVVLARQLNDRDAATIRETLDNYYGPNLAAKLSIILRGKLTQAAPQVIEALNLKGLTNEAIAHLLKGIGELGAPDARKVLETWATGNGRVKNAEIRIAAASALIENGGAEVALQVLEELYEKGGTKRKHELELPLALAKLALGRPAKEMRVHLLNYWREFDPIDYPSIQVVSKMRDRELIAMILGEKERKILADAKESLREKDPELYEKIYPDPESEPSEAKKDEIHPIDQLRAKYPDLHQAIFRTEMPAIKNPDWIRLGQIIWNPEMAIDPRVTAEAITILQGFLAEWGPIRDELLPILEKWVERGTALDANEAVLARSLMHPKLGSTRGLHQVRKLLNNPKLEHAPEALLELGWALAEAGAKTEATEIAKKLLQIPHLAIEAGKLMDKLDPTWDETN